MMVYGIVMAALLLFPWTLLGVSIVGAAVSAVRRNLAHCHVAGWIEGWTSEQVLLPAIPVGISRARNH